MNNMASNSGNQLLIVSTTTMPTVSVAVYVSRYPVRAAGVGNYSLGKSEERTYFLSRDADVCIQTPDCEGAMKKRCEWCGSDTLYIAYHDDEWGVPVHDDQRLFEMLILEGAQAGLSWLTILKKRQNYCTAFDAFDVDKVARYSELDVKRLLTDPGIVRNRLKVASAIKNAQGILNIRETYGTLDAFLWRIVDGEPIQNDWRSQHELPSRTELSDMMSKELKGRGFNFVGSTICYAFMQSVGMVNDHVIDCYRHREVRGMSRPDDV
jgi:DNA-3-methyladenine glycosylase I